MCDMKGRVYTWLNGSSGLVSSTGDGLGGLLSGGLLGVWLDLLLSLVGERLASDVKLALVSTMQVKSSQVWMDAHVPKVRHDCDWKFCLFVSGS